MTAPKIPVMFVHGMWLHPTSWQLWMERFAAAGYAPVAPGWPGVAETVEQTRENGDAQAGNGLAEITEHLAAVAAKLDSPPILIGHSVGGFLVEKLLADNAGRAAVAISPAQIKGVKAVGTGQAKTLLPILSHPGNRHRAVALDVGQFRHSFANAVPGESDDLFARWAIPSPARPLFQLALSNLEHGSPAEVDTGNEDRGPLLLMAAGQDETVDTNLVHSAYHRYRKSAAVTDLKDYPDRGHSLVIDSGASQLIDDTLTWLRGHQLT